MLRRTLLEMVGCSLRYCCDDGAARLSTAKSALIGSGHEPSGKGDAKGQARHFAPQKISGPFRQIAGRRSERLRKALDLTLADTSIDLCGMWPPKHT